MTDGSRQPRRVRGTTPEIDEAARRHRIALTSAEAMLWQALKGRAVDGLKFRRQHPLGRFILDFCCPVLKLAIEIDGAVHDDQHEYDQARTEHLQQYGYRLIRFRNEEVLYHLDRVLEAIRATAEAIQAARTSGDMP